MGYVGYFWLPYTPKNSRNKRAFLSPKNSRICDNFQGNEKPLKQFLPFDGKRRSFSFCSKAEEVKTTPNKNQVAFLSSKIGHPGRVAVCYYMLCSVSVTNFTT